MPRRRDAHQDFFASQKTLANNGPHFVRAMRKAHTHVLQTINPKPLTKNLYAPAGI